MDEVLGHNDISVTNQNESQDDQVRGKVHRIYIYNICFTTYNPSNRYLISDLELGVDFVVLEQTTIKSLLVLFLTDKSGFVKNSLGDLEWPELIILYQ